MTSTKALNPQVFVWKNTHIHFDTLKALFPNRARGPCLPISQFLGSAPYNPDRIHPHPLLWDGPGASALPACPHVQLQCPPNAQLNARPQRPALDFRLPTTHARGGLETELRSPGSGSPGPPDPEKSKGCWPQLVSEADHSCWRLPYPAAPRSRSSTRAHLASDAQSRCMLRVSRLRSLLPRVRSPAHAPSAAEPAELR